jgi:hypothetical protein
VASVKVIYTPILKNEVFTRKKQGMGFKKK